MKVYKYYGLSKLMDSRLHKARTHSPYPYHTGKTYRILVLIVCFYILKI